MALAAKDHMSKHNSTMAIIQASAFYDNKFGGSPNSSQENTVQRISDQQVCQESGSPEKGKNNLGVSNSSSTSSPSSTNSNGLGYHAAGYNLSEEDHNSVISFKPEFGHPFDAERSLLSFDAKRMSSNLYAKFIGGEDEYPVWEENLNHLNGYQMNPKCMSGAAADSVMNHGMPCISSSHYTASLSNGFQFEWLNDHQEGNANGNVNQELGRHEEGNNKRPYTGECSTQPLKKQCGVASNSASKKPKTKPESPAKDTQSIAAKNRRERISERLKVLQELVPNGSKVDLVTMLEKAISYVKFLQLQVKVLATDEFWPAQGGKAPDLSQVREAIDAILASQRSDKNSSSK